MASLYKKPIVVRDPQNGKKIKTQSSKWWGRYRNVDGSEKRVPLAVDKKAAQAMLNQIVKKVELRAAGLVDPFEESRKKSLGKHVDDFMAFLKNKGNTPGYVAATEQRLRTIIKECKFATIDQISASRILEFLGQLRESGLSVGSSNHYLRAIKMFARWLVRDRRFPEDRILHLSKMNVNAKRCRIRRPLTVEEFGKLLEAARTGPTLQSISSPDRAILYTLAAYTGYRRNEIGSVTIRSFDFKSSPPTLTVEAGHSKHRRRDILPLRTDFAEQIQAWYNAKKIRHPDLPLFDIKNRDTSAMIQKDLKRAGIPYIDDRGHYADFHALRKTFITNLCRSGVSPKTAQLLARHSDINLTMNTYTTLGIFDQATAVESLPPVPGAHTETETQRIRVSG